MHDLVKMRSGVCNYMGEKQFQS